MQQETLQALLVELTPLSRRHGLPGAIVLQEKSAIREERCNRRRRPLPGFQCCDSIPLGNGSPFSVGLIRRVRGFLKIVPGLKAYLRTGARSLCR